MTPRGVRTAARRVRSLAGVWLVSLAALSFGGRVLSAQTYPTGPQVLTFFSDVDDTDQPYALYLPKDYNASKKYPLVISLHGAGSNHRLNLRRVFGKGNLPGESDAEATRYFPSLRDVNYIVACPLARGTLGFQGIAERDVYDVLRDVKKRFSIDEDRVYVTGLSMGGGGALWLGLTRPDLWAAVAPVCAAAPSEAPGLAGNALNLPIHLFHGSSDPVVPAEASRQWQHDFLVLGCPVEYTEYPNVRHNSWDYAYRNGAIFEWFDQFRRSPSPNRVRFVTRNYKYNSAYWVLLDGIAPGELAEIDAHRTGKREISVTTKNITGFTLRLGGPHSVTIDGRKMQPGTRLSFKNVGKGWQPGRYLSPAGYKRPGAEGPIAEAVASRHIYVYGTGGSPSAPEMAMRRQEALEAAEWSTPRSKLLLSLRTVADKDVRSSDLENANLVLFGTKETNALIARYAGHLPMALNPSAADYGLLFIYPAGGRYVLVNSGLPWWTGADQIKRTSLPFGPAQYRMLQTFADYILFKGSLENVIAEGFFTPEWRLPSEAVQKMRATGAVEVQ